MARLTAIPTSPLAFILTFSLILFLLWAPNQLVSFEDSLSIATPSLTGFEVVKPGVFQAVKAPSEFHSLNTPIALIPNSYYRFRYNISQLPREKVILTADLYAPGYDNPEQELSGIVGMNDLGKQRDFIFNTGKSPDHAYFRLFYSGAPGLGVANIQITRVAAWNIWLKRGLWAGAIGALLVLILMTINWVRNLSSPSLVGEASKSRILFAEIPTVVALYLVAVLIRFSMYIVMPYWSGDEYVYKSIAAGIWHFGHHGVLTDSMISHSVDLPNLLYPYLISPAFVLSENFYIGVRLINAIVINMAIFPSYLIARKYLAQTPALVAASLSIAIPFINLGAFAVTEVLFFPLFLLSVWIAIESIDRKYSIGWAIAFGLVAAVLMNVRLNAMAMLPAYLFSLLWISLRQQQAITLLTRPYWLVAVISFLGTYVALKYSLDGRSIGEFGIYAGIAARTEGPLSIIANNPIGIFHLIAGHLTTLSVPYALPIALMTFAILTKRGKLSNDDKFSDFLIIASIFSLALFLLALIFTIGVSPFDLGGLGRWHSRYYFYFYPLVIIAGAVFADRLQLPPSTNRFGVIVFVVLLLACNVYFIKILGVLQNPWFGSIADNMDVQWYRSAGQFYWLFIAFTLVLAWLWYKRSAYFMRGLVSFMFAWVIVANYGTMQYAGVGRGVQQAAVELQHATDLTLSVPCGALAANFLDHNPGRFIIVGDSASTMVNAAFWNPYIPKKTIVYNGGSKLLGAAEVGIAAEYLIVNGRISVDAAYRPLLSIGKCSIYEIPN
jgi:hypothetical protein